MFDFGNNDSLSQRDTENTDNFDNYSDKEKISALISINEVSHDTYKEIVTSVSLAGLISKVDFSDEQAAEIYRSFLPDTLVFFKVKNENNLPEQNTDKAIAGDASEYLKGNWY